MVVVRTVLADHPGRLLGALNVALGVVLLVGSSLRTSSYSFTVARELMPVAWWGLAFLLGGVACLAATHAGWWGVGALMFGAGVHAFWTGALAAAAVRDTRAALTGVVVYGWLSLLHLLVGVRLAGRRRV